MIQDRSSILERRHQKKETDGTLKKLATAAPTDDDDQLPPVIQPLRLFGNCVDNGVGGRRAEWRPIQTSTLTNVHSALSAGQSFPKTNPRLQSRITAAGFQIPSLNNDFYSTNVSISMTFNITLI